MAGAQEKIHQIGNQLAEVQFMSTDELRATATTLEEMRASGELDEGQYPAVMRGLGYIAFELQMREGKTPAEAGEAITGESAQSPEDELQPVA